MTKELFSVKHEACGITKGPDHQSSIEVTGNAAYIVQWNNNHHSLLIQFTRVYHSINENIWCMLILKLWIFIHNSVLHSSWSVLHLAVSITSKQVTNCSCTNSNSAYFAEKGTLNVSYNTIDTLSEKNCYITVCIYIL